MKKPTNRGHRRRTHESDEAAAESQETREAMTEHAEATSAPPQSTTSAAQAPAANGTTDGQTMHRAEEMVDRAAERVGHYVSVVGRTFLQWFARAREEAEDILAEAQHIRRGGK